MTCTEFSHVARHVVESQGIGLEHAYCVGAVLAVPFGPSHLIGFIASAVFVLAWRFALVVCPLPLLFCRQAELESGYLVEAIDEQLGLVPVETLYGAIAHSVL